MSQVKIKQLLGPVGTNQGSLVVYDSRVSCWSSDISSAILLPRGDSLSRPSNPANGMLRYNTDLNLVETYENNNWIASGNISTFATLSDGPGSLQAGMGIKVNSLGTALQYYAISGGVSLFSALADGPGSLQANQGIKVNSSGTSLQYYSVLSTFASLSDGPGSLQANLGIKVNSLGTALQYYTISTSASFAALTDGPGSLQANMGVGVNSLGTALQYYPFFKHYRFQANYAGQTYPSTVTNAPTGWTFGFGTNSSIIVTHNVGAPPIYVNFIVNNPAVNSNIYTVKVVGNQTASGIYFNYDITNPTVFTIYALNVTNMTSSTTGMFYVDCYFA